MATVKFAGIEVEVVEIVEGFNVISALAHEIVFEDGGKLGPNQEVAKLVKAAMAEIEVGREGEVVFVTTTPKPDAASEAVLRKFNEEYPCIWVVSSILSVAAFREVLPALVISPVVTEATSRLPPDQKVCHRNKWSA